MCALAVACGATAAGTAAGVAGAAGASPHPAKNTKAGTQARRIMRPNVADLAHGSTCRPARRVNMRRFTGWICMDSWPRAASTSATAMLRKEQNTVMVQECPRKNLDTCRTLLAYALLPKALTQGKVAGVYADAHAVAYYGLATEAQTSALRRTAQGGQRRARPHVAGNPARRQRNVRYLERKARCVRRHAWSLVGPSWWSCDPGAGDKAIHQLAGLRPQNVRFHSSPYTRRGARLMLGPGAHEACPSACRRADVPDVSSACCLYRSRGAHRPRRGGGNQLYRSEARCDRQVPPAVGSFRKGLLLCDGRRRVSSGNCGRHRCLCAGSTRGARFRTRVDVGLGPL